MLSHWLSPLPAVPFPHPDGISGSCFIAITTGTILMKPSQTPLSFSEQDPTSVPSLGALAMSSHCVMGVDPALVTEPVRLSEKKPVWRKQSQEAQRE